jgi:4a-hydroxytetrahydrobiopterin dehydratase
MKLSDQAINDELAALPGWTLEGSAIRKTFRLRSFPDAIAFVTRVAFDAEAADHHPDIHVSYRNATLVFSTHSAGGLTAKDFDGARQADIVAARIGS